MDAASTHAVPAGWTITRLSGSLGAEVRGVRLSALADAHVAAIRQLLLDHLVLFFPDQHLSADEHVAFGSRFGPLEGHPHLENLTRDPRIFELAATRGGVADEWHADLTFLPAPAVLSVLQIERCPAVGGDTMWSNAYEAYAQLSAPMRELCDGLSALHDATAHARPDRMAIHPVVRVHPETGRKVLYVNEHFTKRIVQVSAPESECLLGFLTRWVTQPRFTVRYRWAAGTVAMWDNRCTQHFVLNDFAGERIIHRVTVVGDRPTGGPSKWEPYVRAGNRSASSHHDRQLVRYLGSQELPQNPTDDHG